ncbi:MAG TPA: sulfate ABC transporter permease subunit CysT [Capsulimonadaceae bacterium]|nr:sulfate ABC transporter permease subunit CysT [Capsulimonadaceae bacterium]
MASLTLKQRSALPGFGLSLGYTVIYLSLIVLIPLSALFLKTATLTWHAFLATIKDPEVLAAFKLTFGASLIAALVNAFFGLLVAWVLGRYKFPGKRFVDGLVDLPFALPTAVAGISLAAIYSDTGWVGKYLAPHNIHIAYSQAGVLVALIFIGLPYVVRTVQPVLEDVDLEIEEAAASLGASRWQTLRRILLPAILPALLTGFALAFARALGEYGSVIFTSDNIPLKSEIVPVVIVNKLNGYDYAGATAIAAVMLVLSFALLLVINLLQRYSTRHERTST